MVILERVISEECWKQEECIGDQGDNICELKFENNTS